MLRKLSLASALAALLTGTAAAQMPMPSMHLGGDKPAPTAEEIAKQKALDKAYKSAIDKVPSKQATDPWGNVRPNPSAQSKNSSNAKP